MPWEVSNRYPRNANTHPYDEALIIQQELDYDVHEQLLIVDRDVPSHNTGHTIFTTTMSAVNDHKQFPKVFFIDGPGGTGKTFLYNTQG